MNYWKDDKENWYETIETISNEMNILPTTIEKDIIQSYILYELAQSEFPFVFKGGTSLSKGYGIINRFSEDIDIAMSDKPTESQRRKAKELILDIAEKYNLTLINPERIKSKSKFNQYRFTYESLFSDEPQQLIIETTYLQVSYPTNKINIGSIVDSYANKHNIELPVDFPARNVVMNTQTIERTFFDKIFAVCDYYLGNRTKKHSRHLYDISELINHIDKTKNYGPLINQIRNDRLSSEKNISADYQYNIPTILQEIINTQVYKEDYETLTMALLYTPTSYEESINNGIAKVLSENVFVNSYRKDELMNKTQKYFSEFKGESPIGSHKNKNDNKDDNKDINSEETITEESEEENRKINPGDD